MYSCCHSSNFLSDNSGQVGKQSAMSKRGQKTTSNEGSLTVKAKPCPVARDAKSEEISSRSLGSLVNPGDADESKGVASGAARLKFKNWVFSSKSTRESSASNQETGAGGSKQKESDERKYSDSTSLRKLAASSPELKNMEYRNHRYVGKIFQCLQQEFENIRSQRNILNGRIQNTCNDMWNVYDLVDESRHPLWAELCAEFGDLQGDKIRGNWKFVQYYSEVGNGTFWRDSECEMSGIFITILGEISIISWSSDQMGEGKKCLSMQIPFYVWDRRMKAKKRKQGGKVKWKDPGCIRLTKMQWVSMEKQLNSSGKFYHNYHHCLFLKKSNKTWRSGRSSQRSSQTRSSSCPCSMTFCGSQMIRIAFRMPTKSRNYAKKFLPGFWTSGSRVGKEMVWGLLQWTVGPYSQQRDWSSYLQ